MVSDFERYVLTKTAAPMTSAKTGKTVFVSKSGEDVTKEVTEKPRVSKVGSSRRRTVVEPVSEEPVPFLKEEPLMTSVKTGEPAVAPPTRTIPTKTAEQELSEQVTRPISVVEPATNIPSKLKREVITPFKEGLTLQPVSEQFRGETGKTPIQELSYAGGLVSSVVLQSGEAGIAAGKSLTKAVSASPRLAPLVTKTTEFLRKKPVKRASVGLGTIFVGAETKEIIETPKGERARALSGTAREVGTVLGFGKGASAALSEIGEESTFLLRGKTKSISVVKDSTAITRAETKGKLFREYKGTLQEEGLVRQFTRQETVSKPLVTETGQSTKTTAFEGRGVSSIELERKGKITQTSVESVFKGRGAAEKESIEIVTQGKVFEKGAFKTRGEVVASTDVFSEGRRSGEVVTGVVKERGAFVKAGRIKLTKGLESSVSDKLVVQTRKAGLVLDFSGFKPSTGVTGVGTVQKVEGKGLEQLVSTIRKQSFKTEKVTPVVVPKRQESFIAPSAVIEVKPKKSVVESTATTQVVSGGAIISTGRVKERTPISTLAPSVTRSELEDELVGSRRKAKPFISDPVKPAPPVTVVKPISKEAAKTLSETSPFKPSKPIPPSPPPSFPSGFGFLGSPFVPSVPSVSKPKFFVGGGVSFGSSRTKRVSQPKSYSPSVTALAFNIEGERPKGTLTGLGLRPVAKKKKKKKKK